MATDKELQMFLQQAIERIDAAQGAVDKARDSVTLVKASLEKREGQGATLGASAEKPREKTPEKPQEKPAVEVAPAARPSITPPEALSVEPLQKQQKQQNAELNLGTKWFSRLGIVALLIGFAMALTYSIPHLSNPIKIMLGFIIAAGMFGLGQLLIKKSAPLLGRIVQGGGLSLGYLSLFAVFFIPSMALFNSPGPGLLCLMIYAIGMLYLAHRLRSEAIAVLSIAYGYFSSHFGLNPIVIFMAAGVLTTLGVVFRTMNPHWRAFTVFMSLGAFMVAAPWRGELANHVKDIYLIATFLLLQVSSFYPANKSSAVQLVLANLLFYGFYLVLGTPWKSPFILGYVEAGLMLVNGWSLFFVMRQHAAVGSTGDAKSFVQQLLVCLSLFFMGVATVRSLDAQVESLVLTGEALLLGLLALQPEQRHPKILAGYTFALLAFGLGRLAFWDLFWLHNNPLTIITGVLTCGVALVMERLVIRKLLPVLGVPSVVVISLILFEVLSVQPVEELVTMSYIAAGVLFLARGLFFQFKSYRYIGIGYFVVAIMRLLFWDMAELPMSAKITVFLGLGIALLAASYGYTMLFNRLSETPSDEAL